jgi:hypothetical protein
VGVGCLAVQVGAVRTILIGYLHGKVDGYWQYIVESGGRWEPQQEVG